MKLLKDEYPSLSQAIIVGILYVVNVWVRIQNIIITSILFKKNKNIKQIPLYSF
jgi:hypothetical protein